MLLALAPREVVVGAPIAPATRRLLDAYQARTPGCRMETLPSEDSSGCARGDGTTDPAAAARRRLTAFYEGLCPSGGGVAPGQGQGQALARVMALPPLVLRALAVAHAFLEPFGLAGVLGLVEGFRGLAAAGDGGGGSLSLSANALRQLDVLSAGPDGGAAGSLLHLMDRTRTAAGGRLLRAWLAAPLAELEAIRARQQAVAEVAEHGSGSGGLQGPTPASPSAAELGARAFPPPPPACTAPAACSAKRCSAGTGLLGARAAAARGRAGRQGGRSRTKPRCTPAGQLPRLRLAAHLPGSCPGFDPAACAQPLDGMPAFAGPLASLPKLLKGLPDLEKGLARMLHGTASPAEAVAVLRALEQVREVALPPPPPPCGLGDASAHPAPPPPRNRSGACACVRSRGAQAAAKLGARAAVDEAPARAAAERSASSPLLAALFRAAADPQVGDDDPCDHARHDLTWPWLLGAAQLHR